MFDDVEGLLAAADVHVAPAADGSPQALVEAMAAGVPSVAIDVPLNRWLLGDDAAGLLVPPENAAALAAAIARLLDDPALAARLGAGRLAAGGSGVRPGEDGRGLSGTVRERACEGVNRVELLPVSPRKSSRGRFLRILNRDLWISVCRRHSQTLRCKQVRVLLHGPTSLIDAILNRMADTGKSIKVRRIKTEEVRFFCRLDDQGIRQVNHGLFAPAISSLLPSKCCYKYLQWQLLPGTLDYTSRP